MFRFRLLQFRDLLVNRYRQLRSTTLAGIVAFESLLPVLTVKFGPIIDRLHRDPHLAGNNLCNMPFFQVQLHRTAPDFVGVRSRATMRLACPRHTGNGPPFTRPREPPRGLLLPILLPSGSCLLPSCFNLRIHW
jgi:hypothetical protein